jgi:hypothetical protein
LQRLLSPAKPRALLSIDVIIAVIADKNRPHAASFGSRSALFSKNESSEAEKAARLRSRPVNAVGLSPKAGISAS